MPRSVNKITKIREKSTQDPVKKLMTTKIFQTLPQELTENCKNKEVFDKASESDSTLTKMIEENYLLKRENKKLQERKAVLDNVIEEILVQQDKD